MANTLFIAPTTNFIQKTLNGSITNAATTITLNSTTSMQAPGYIVIDRTDSNGTSTPTAREVVSYTGISGSDLTGCTRGADNSSALSHADGAIVETVPTVGMFNSLATIVATAVSTDGYLRAIASPVSIARLEANQLYASVASIAILQTNTRLMVSGASLTGFGIYPTWRTSGTYSGPTTFVGGILSTPRAGQLQWVSILTRYVVSGASVAFDIKKNGSSIFANATTMPAIAAGGTFVSTASIATRNIDSGDRLNVDINSVGTAGIVTDLTIQGGTA